MSLIGRILVRERRVLFREAPEALRRPTEAVETRPGARTRL